MAAETGGVEQPSPKEISPVHAREQRVHSYMTKFNRIPAQDARSELGQLLVKTKGFPIAQQDFIREVSDAVNPTKDKLTMSEAIVDKYTEALESQRSAEDAMVALLYDIQTPLHGRGMTVATPELPKLLKILEDTRMRRESQFAREGFMDSSKDQAVLFLTQVYFYDAERAQGKRVIHTEAGKNPSLDEVEIIKLVRKLNQYLPEGDRFIIQEEQPAPLVPNATILSLEKLMMAPDQKKDPQTINEQREPSSPIRTAAERKRAEELEDVLYDAQGVLQFTLDNPDKPIDLDATKLPQSAVGEVFGSEGKGNLVLFSLISSISPDARRKVVNWLMTEKGATKRREKIREITAVSQHLFHDLLSPETKGVFDNAFFEDLLNRDAATTRLHRAVLARIPEGEKKGKDEMRELLADAAERLFFLKHSHILGNEIREEIMARRKAMKITPIDSEDKVAAGDIEELIKKIQDQLEFPTDVNAAIMPYELNVGYVDDFDTSQRTAHLLNGESVDKELFSMKKEKLNEYVAALCLEKWTHQARSNQELRKTTSSEEGEKLGHVMPYAIDEVKDERGRTERVQTYFMYDYTPDPNDHNRGQLYIDSQTGLSLPIVLVPAKKEGDYMRIEYVYGSEGTIPGIKARKVNT